MSCSLVSAAMEGANESATFKHVPGVKKCSISGVLLQGKRVLQPLRFFVTEPGVYF